MHKSHNVTVLMYHLVFPAKYRRAVFDAAVDEELRELCKRGRAENIRSSTAITS